MLAEQHSLRQKMRDWLSLSKMPDAQSVSKAQRLQADITQKLSRSQAQYLARKNGLPKPEYSLDLPVSSRREEIANAIQQNQVIIVCGETGSGKPRNYQKFA
jgi:ATP-dependent helicase HrpA